MPKYTVEALLEHVWRSPGRTSRRIQAVKWRPGDAERQFGAPGTSQNTLTGVQETREHANGAPTAQKEEFETLLGDIRRSPGSTPRSIQAWHRHLGDQKRQFWGLGAGRAARQAFFQGFQAAKRSLGKSLDFKHPAKI